MQKKLIKNKVLTHNLKADHIKIVSYLQPMKNTLVKNLVLVT